MKTNENEQMLLRTRLPKRERAMLDKIQNDLDEILQVYAEELNNSKSLEHCNEEISDLMTDLAFDIMFSVTLNFYYLEQ